MILTIVLTVSIKLNKEVYNLEFIIDSHLLKQELALNSLSIIIDMDYYSQDIVMDLFSIENIINQIFDFIQNSNQETDGRKKIVRIKTIENFLVLIARNYIIELRNNSLLLLSQDTEFYLCIVYLTAYLSRISPNYFNFYKTLFQNIPSMIEYFQDTQCYIDSNDIRGLLYTAHKKYLNLDQYDRQFLYRNKNYLYTPPKVDKEWIIKYRRVNQPVCFWFYESHYGIGLFIVLYSLKCRYAKCIGCSLHELSSPENLNTQMEIYKQIDYVIEEISNEEKKMVNEIILSNNGNMMDSATMPTLSLLYIIDKCITHFPGLKKVILESRLEYINEAKLDNLQETINNKGIELEIAFGLEIFDDFYRNNFYKKGIKIETLEKMMEVFTNYNLSVRVYMMFKACAQMNLEESIIDINQAANYLSQIASKRNIKIILHISPTYVAKGSQLETLYHLGQYKPPDLYDIEQLLNNLEVYKNISYYISFNDEGLSLCNLQEDYFEFVRIKEKIESFNMKL